MYSLRYAILITVTLPVLNIVLHVWERLAVQKRLFINGCNYELVTGTTLICHRYMQRRTNNITEEKIVHYGPVFGLRGVPFSVDLTANG